MNNETHINKRDFIAWTESKKAEYNNISIDKVIFLDIDGVLNDEGINYRKGVIIDKKMVSLLKEIVSAIGAEIILSSSWRLDYLRFVEDDYKTTDKDILELDSLFTEAGLSVRGILPLTSWSGPSSRPAEICEWLETIPVNEFVILDDDDFWMWDKYKLKEHVVLTKKKAGYDFVRGLKEENVQQAITILTRSISNV